jgi:16S rRNA (guanine(1405)-N(7))-methyltransferase
LDYHAYDIYTDLVDFVDAFIKMMCKGHAEVKDVLFDPPQLNADLALILKTIPCFHQVDRSATVALLERINADNMVVSFPVKSLGGTEKMMVKNYTETFDRLIFKGKWETKKIVFDTELVFLLRKKS